MQIIDASGKGHRITQDMGSNSELRWCLYTGWCNKLHVIILNPTDQVFNPEPGKPDLNGLHWKSLKVLRILVMSPLTFSFSLRGCF